MIKLSVIMNATKVRIKIFEKKITNNNDEEKR